MSAVAAILQTIEDLPVIDRERIYQAILRDSSVEELTAELNTVNAGDDLWDEIVWFAKKILAEDNDFQKEAALDVDAPSVDETDGALLPNDDEGRAPHGHTNPCSGPEQAGPG